jgi:hypothetical protein
MALAFYLQRSCHPPLPEVDLPRATGEE